MSAPLKLTDETFALAIDAEPLVVVDFWAPWCAPCLALGPVVDRLADRYNGRVTFGKLDVDENSATAHRFGVQSIPAVLFFRGGEVVDRTVGALPESLLATKVDQLLSAHTRASLRTPAPQGS